MTEPLVVCEKAGECADCDSCGRGPHEKHIGCEWGCYGQEPIPQWQQYPKLYKCIPTGEEPK